MPPIQFQLLVLPTTSFDAPATRAADAKPATTRLPEVFSWQGRLFYPMDFESPSFEKVLAASVSALGFAWEDVLVVSDDYRHLQQVQSHPCGAALVAPKPYLVGDGWPIHDFEISNLSDLFETSQIRPGVIPTLQTCLDWWEVWDVPENVRRHMKEVARLAYWLSMQLLMRGVRLNPLLVHRAGLVHDLDKIATLHQSGQHGRKGASFLDAQGYPAVAEVVRGHLLDTIFDWQALFESNKELVLVNYADKLVEGDQIVPLPVRLEALKTRYPASRSLIEASERPLFELDEYFRSILSISNHKKFIIKAKKLQKY
jgi:putative nucleotidyltransferase with HDIG domain